MVVDSGLERAHRPSRREFLAEWVRPGRPVILTGMLQEWPAFGKWTPEFFRRAGAGRRVRIEWGNVLHDRPRFEERDLGWYMERIAEPSGDGPVPYLAYFDIFKAFPELRGDVDFGLWKGRVRFPVGWIGPAGTFTGLHWDIAPNLFAQFHGTKEFTLYPPDQGRYLYPARRYDIGSVLSEVDTRAPDLSRHPLFARARGRRVAVRAGEILFTPRGWWHDVRGLETSISVSCFGFGAVELLRDALPGAARHALHLLGLYRKGECACHVQPEPQPQPEPRPAGREAR